MFGRLGSVLEPPRAEPKLPNDDIASPHRTVIDAWRTRVQRFPDNPAIAYFDTVLTAREVDDASDALAAALSDTGVSRGDRVGIYL